MHHARYPAIRFFRKENEPRATLGFGSNFMKLEPFDKLLKHDDGYSLKGSDELGWFFVEGKKRKFKVQPDILTTADHRAINACAKRRGISTITSNGQFYLKDDDGNFVRIDSILCQE